MGKLLDRSLTIQICRSTFALVYYFRLTTDQNHFVEIIKCRPDREILSTSLFIL